MKNSSFQTAPLLDSKGNKQFSGNHAPLNWVEPDGLTQAERKAQNEARKSKSLTRKSK